MLLVGIHMRSSAEKDIQALTSSKFRLYDPSVPHSLNFHMLEVDGEILQSWKDMETLFSPSLASSSCIFHRVLQRNDTQSPSQVAHAS